MTNQLQIRVWGTRGSIPMPGPSTLKYGGNTSCLEVRCGGDILIFDAGTGLRNLGNRLLAEMPMTVHLFLSHLHWDHIQGFPFFEPIFHPGNRIIIYGERKGFDSLKAAFASQMKAPYFPVSFPDLAAELVFKDLAPNQEIQIGDHIQIRMFRAWHPNDSLAFRLQYGSHSLAYITDAEMFDDDLDPNLIEAAREVNYLVCDGMFTTEQYLGKNGHPCRKGWGHMTWEQAIELAQAANVNHLLLWHHYQYHDDTALQQLEKQARQRFPNAQMAYEGQEIIL